MFTNTSTAYGVEKEQIMPSNTNQGDELDGVLTAFENTSFYEGTKLPMLSKDEAKAKLNEMLLAAEQNALRKLKMRYDLTPSQEQYILRITDPAEYEKQEENYNGTHRMS